MKQVMREEERAGGLQTAENNQKNQAGGRSSSAQRLYQLHLTGWPTVQFLLLCLCAPPRWVERFHK